MLRKWLLLALTVTSLSVVGCDFPPPTAVRSFVPNKAYAYRFEYETEESYDGHLADINRILDKEFGTVESPILPKAIASDSDLANFVDVKKVQRAVGAHEGGNPAEAIYVKNCVNCHASEGSGRGPGSAGVDPYPRDFRAGIFKYKTTNRNAKPTKADLLKTVRYGLAGSGMGAYDKLTDEERQEAVEYVVYIAIRGEVERKLLENAFENFTEGDRWASSAPEDAVVKVSDERQEEIDTIIAEVATSWMEAEEAVVEVTRPTDRPILEKKPASWDEVTGNPELLASVNKGKELFLSATAACASCHGPGGLGDGRLNDYDDWTKEWTVRINIEPTDKDELLPFVLRGALPPKPIKPRNLREGIHRGGSSPEDLFLRLRYGIPGAPMPAITPVENPQEAGLTEGDLWHLVNYIYAMPVEPGPWPTAPVGAPTTEASTAETEEETSDE